MGPDAAAALWLLASGVARLWALAAVLAAYAAVYALVRRKLADRPAEMRQADRLLCCWASLYSGRACWCYNLLFAPALLLVHACRIYGGSCLGVYGARLFWLAFGPCMGYFVDKDFPPEASSLGQVAGDDANQESGKSDGSVVWVRAMDFCRKDVRERPPRPALFGTEMCLFQGRIEAFIYIYIYIYVHIYIYIYIERERDIEACDILQGALGDCWLLAAIAALAEREGGISARFLTREVDPRGQYKVSLFDPQEKRWRVVVVDDHVPCERDSREADGVRRGADGMPEAQYARPYGREIWAMILEKAFAKLCGGYAAIEAGITEWGIVCLTGGEAWRYELAKGGLWRRSDMEDIVVDYCISYYIIL